MYVYPDNLKSKPTLWLWQLRDIGIIGIEAVVAVFVLSKVRTPIPVVIAALHAFLTIRFEDISILDFITYAFRFFVSKNQFYKWRGVEK